MKLLSLFTGIGAFEKSLDRLGIPYELVGFSEIDKYAVESYCEIHRVDKSKSLGDITKIDEKTLPKDIDLITYGFPCQDISLAGKQKGLFNEDGSQTRSGLFFEALRIIEETQPKVAIAENVKNLVGKKFKEQFDIVLDSLEQAGYNNYWQVLNAKDYGIPQNRERVFIVSIRKDVDNGTFTFPEGFPLELRLKDMLEDVVDEKFYISNKMTEYLINTKFNSDADVIQNGDVCKCLRAGGTTPCVEEQPTLIGGMQKNQSVKTDGICTTLTSSMGTGGGYVPMVTEPVIRQVGNIRPTKNRPNPNQGRVYDPNYISPSLNTCGGGNLEPHVVINVGNVNPSGRGQNGQVIDSEGLARTITQEKGEGQKILVREPSIQKVDIPQTVRVRKYPVDKKGLCECLRDYNQESDFSIKEIAEALDVPKTTVEHWFRQDDCFAIPDAEVWLKLKELLGIVTDEFDEAIMTFEEKEGAFEKAERHYFADGIAPTLTSTSGNEKIIVVGNYSPSGHDASRIVDEDGIAPCVKENHGTVTAVAMRGRYNEDGRVEQNIEVSDREYANAITTVQKDSLIQNNLRIRKLTPKECFRLMGFDDADFEKAEKVNSNTQLYKQAGNSIVVDVLEYLIKALIDSGAFEIRKEQKEMELRIDDFQKPSPIGFNYEEIKQGLIEKTAMYTNLVYTDENIKDAKADRANLNKLKTVLNDERKRLEKEYMQPFNDTKAKFNELIALVDEPTKAIDSQIKAYEEKEKAEKLEKIKEFWAEQTRPSFLTFEQIFEEKWLNKSESMKSVCETIETKLTQISIDVTTLSNLPEFGFEATEVYKTTLDMNKAINEAKRMVEVAKARAEHETKIKAQEEAMLHPTNPIGQVIASTERQAFENAMNPPVDEEPVKQWMSFSAYLSVEDARALKQFFNDRNIEFKAV